MIRHLLCAFVLAGMAAAPGAAQTPPTYGNEWFLAGVPTDVTVQYEAGDWYVYVVDQATDEVVKYNRNGAFILQWGTSGPAPGQFQAPTSIAAHPNKTLYVAEQIGDRVQAFVNTNVFTLWGSNGVGPGQFDAPAGIHVDDQGFVYVAEDLNDRVSKFDELGNYITFYSSAAPLVGGVPYALSLGPRSGVASDGENNLYVTDTNHHVVVKLDPAGQTLLVLGTFQTPSSLDGEFDTPVDVAVDADGLIYVADSGNDRIQCFNPDGTFRYAWGTTGGASGEFLAPQGIAILDWPGGGGRAIYVADAGNARIQVFESREPAAAFCTVPPLIPMTQDGSLEYAVEVQTTLGPIAGVEVEISFSPEADALIAWHPGQTRPVSGFTDPGGGVSFYLMGSGCVEPSRFSGPIAEILADGIRIGTAGVISPDVVNPVGTLATDLGQSICADGRTAVDLSDMVFFADPISSPGYEPCLDFNGDNQSDLTDVLLFTIFAASSGLAGPCN